MIELNYYKIGYKNYDYFLARKTICYQGKKITFQWSVSHFHNVILNLIQNQDFHNPENH